MKKSVFLLLLVIIIGFAIVLQMGKSNDYVNEKYGFTFKIPDSWKGKYDVVERDNSITFVYSQYEFESGGYQEFFTIGVTSKEEYENTNNPLMTGELLAEKDEQVYLLYMPLDCIILDEDKLQEYTDINLSVDEIKNRFMLNN